MGKQAHRQLYDERSHQRRTDVQQRLKQRLRPPRSTATATLPLFRMCCGGPSDTHKSTQQWGRRPLRSFSGYLARTTTSNGSPVVTITHVNRAMKPTLKVLPLGSSVSCISSLLLAVARGWHVSDMSFRSYSYVLFELLGRPFAARSTRGKGEV